VDKEIGKFMTNDISHRGFWRAFLALIIVVFLVMSCGSDDDEEDETETTEGCPTEIDGEAASQEDGAESQAPEYDSKPYVEQFNASELPWCLVGAVEKTNESLLPCLNSDKEPTGEYQLTDGEGRIVFAFSPAFRFHPSDEPGNDPQRRAHIIPDLDQAEADRNVVVVDREDHGLFIGQIIHKQTGIKPARIEVGTSGEQVTDSELEAAIKRIPDGSIVNLSLGTYVCTGDTKWDDSKTKAAMEERIDKKVTFVVSAGNSEFDQQSWPAAMSLDDPSALDGDEDIDVWSVGATTDEKMDTRSCYSNYGNWVSAWAPGDEIVPDPDLVWKAGEGGAGQVLHRDDTEENLPVMSWSGTSFAAPQVLAQLMLGQEPSTKTPNAPTEEDPQYKDTNGNSTFCDPDLGYKPGKKPPN